MIAEIKEKKAYKIGRENFYQVYLSDKEKVICIKELKIVGNLERKKTVRLLLTMPCNVMIVSQVDIISYSALWSSNFPNFFFHLIALDSLCFFSYNQTQSVNIFKKLWCNDTSKNHDVRRIFFELQNVINISN